MRPRRLSLWLTVAIVAVTPVRLRAQTITSPDYYPRRDYTDRQRDIQERVSRQVERSMRTAERTIERTSRVREQNAERLAERAAARVQSRVAARSYFDRAAFDRRMERMHDQIERAQERARTYRRRW